LAKPVIVNGPGGIQREVIEFPLKSMKVHIDVKSSMAEYTVEQVFENPVSETIEAVYLFPLGDEAAISSYEIVIGDRVIKGEIKTKKEARRIYKKAKEDKHITGLLEQHKANVFQQSVANIPAGRAVTVRFRYVEMADYEDGRYEIVFPMVVGPRFTPAEHRGRSPVSAHHAGTPAGSGTSIPYDASYAGPAITLTASVNAGVPIHAITSPSHAVKESKLSTTSSKVVLANNQGAANRDFIMRYQVAGPKTTMGMLTHKNADLGYFVMTVQPKENYKTGDIAAREMVFLIDVSGSMSGRSLDISRTLTKALIQTLNPKDTFNVMSFASGTNQMSKGPIAADQAGIARGLQWVDALSAGGGTDMELGMLRSLTRKPGGDRVRMVYMLSDGFIGNDDVILSAARKHLSANRIFPIGIGSSPNRYLFDRLGEVGRGFTSYLYEYDEASEMATELVDKSAYPYLTNLKIDWSGLDVRDLSPAKLPDVYAGQPIVVTGRFKKPGQAKVKLKARAAGRDVVIPLDVTLPDLERQRSVAYLWARQRIKELMSNNFGQVTAADKQAVTGIGLGFGLVTEYTSYVAVDKTRVVSDSGQVRTIVQPAPMPEGVNAATAIGSPASPSGSSSYASSSRSYGSGSGGSSGGGGYSGGGGGGGGGDLDPLTLLLSLTLIPIAIFLRRRRRHS
jgi:Ca-activated chloride channel family protein